MQRFICYEDICLRIHISRPLLWSRANDEPMRIRAFAARVMDDGIAWLMRGIALVVEQATGLYEGRFYAGRCDGLRWVDDVHIEDDVRRQTLLNALQSRGRA